MSITPGTPLNTCRRRIHCGDYPDKGYVDITAATAAEGGGIIMSSHETNDLTKLPAAPKLHVCGGTCLENTTMVSKIQYYDTSLASAKNTWPSQRYRFQGAAVRPYHRSEDKCDAFLPCRFPIRNKQYTYSGNV